MNSNCAIWRTVKKDSVQKTFTGPQRREKLVLGSIHTDCSHVGRLEPRYTNSFDAEKEFAYFSGQIIRHIETAFLVGRLS